MNNEKVIKKVLEHSIGRKKEKPKRRCNKDVLKDVKRTGLETGKIRQTIGKSVVLHYV